MISLPLAGAARALLPAKYSYDSDAIQRIALGTYLPLQDPSYMRVGYLYRDLGVAGNPAAAGVIGMTLAVAALWCALRMSRGRMTAAAYPLVALFAVTASAYLSEYSKDVWVLPVVLVVLLAPPGWRGELSIVVAIAAYAGYLRSYWFLVLLLYMGLRVVTVRRLRRRTVVAVLLAAVVVVVLAAPVILHQDIQTIRDSVNVDRLGSADAVTAIQPPNLGANPAAQIVENLLVLGQLVAPVPLLVHASPIHAVYGLAILGIWVLFGRRVFVIDDRLLDGRPARLIDQRTTRAAFLLLAFVTIQTFFEPDYGSYLRHLTPLLPLLIAVVVSRPGADPAGPLGALDSAGDRAGRSPVGGRPPRRTAPAAAGAPTV